MATGHGAAGFTRRPEISCVVNNIFFKFGYEQDYVGIVLKGGDARRPWRTDEKRPCF